MNLGGNFEVIVGDGYLKSM